MGSSRRNRIYSDLHLSVINGLPFCSLLGVKHFLSSKSADMKEEETCACREVRGDDSQQTGFPPQSPPAGPNQQAMGQKRCFTA